MAYVVAMAWDGELTGFCELLYTPCTNVDVHRRPVAIAPLGSPTVTVGAPLSQIDSSTSPAQDRQRLERICAALVAAFEAHSETRDADRSAIKLDRGIVKCCGLAAMR